MTVVGLRCRECGEEHECAALYACARCLGPLEVAYLPQFLPAARLRAHIERGPRNIARYRDFLPVPSPGPALPAGGTPLIRAHRLAEVLGLEEVWVKNDAANPTHSFKDRVVGCAVPVAQELGFGTIACASTGNLANSVAAHAAALGLEARVFVPEGLEPAKLAATRVHGAHVVELPGTYDDVNRECTEMADDGWAFVNINLRPYYAEGSKTLAFEIAEQLGWELPDRCVVPIASGSLYVKMARGFEEWIDAGLVEGRIPRMSGAQASGCAPVAEAYMDGAAECRPVKPSTIAKSLAIGSPADGAYALRVAHSTGGGIDCVTDREIVRGIRLLAETTGIFTETAGGVATAVLRKMAERGEIDPRERVVLVITGDGLKTLEAVC